MALLTKTDEVYLKIPVQASGKHCAFCRFQLYMGIAMCQLFNKTLKTKKGEGFQFTLRHSECLKAQQTK